jgi:EspG family
MSIDSPTLGDVTVNVDGLWLLQALLGIPTVAPELNGLPYGAAPSNDWIDEHPGMDILRDEGLVDADARVAPALEKRMRVLSTPDVEVAVLVSRGAMDWTPLLDLEDPSTWLAIREEQLRVVLARRDDHWVSAVRAGEEITIDDVNADGGGADWLRATALGILDGLNFCEPSTMAPMTLPFEDVAAAAKERTELPEGPTRDAPLRALGVSGPALAQLARLLADPVLEAVLYARAYSDAKVHYSATVMNFRDTDGGRVVSYQMTAVRGSTQAWMSFAPATLPAVDQAVRAVLNSLPIDRWESHRRM